MATKRTPGLRAEQLSDLPIPPGEYLAEVLAELSLNQLELARQLARPPQTISAIVRGKKAITADTAIQFETALGVPAYFWLNLEAQYQLALARQRLAVK